jgi:hypothetical protein
MQLRAIHWHQDTDSWSFVFEGGATIHTDSQPVADKIATEHNWPRSKGGNRATDVGKSCDW